MKIIDKTISVYLIGLSAIVLSLSDCIPPPPELEAARKKQAEQQIQTESSRPQSMEETLNQPVPIPPAANDIPLSASYTTGLKDISYKPTDNYFNHLTSVLLKYNTIEVNDQTFRVKQESLAPNVQKLDLNSMLRLLQENGFKIYVIQNFVTEDLLYLIKYNLPFYIALNNYCDVGPVNFKASFILVSGYSDYTPGDLNHGSITYQGFVNQEMNLQKFINLVGKVYIPVKDKESFRRVQAAWQGFHEKNILQKMPSLFTNNDYSSPQSYFKPITNNNTSFLSIEGPAAKSPDRDNDVIRAVMMANMAGIKSCYENELHRDNNLSGKIIIRFSIEADGHVTNTMVVKSDIGSSILEQCILNYISMIAFRSIPDSEGNVILTYTFFFAPQ